MDLFESCQKISGLLNDGDESGARDAVIRLMDGVQSEGIKPTPFLNHLLREVGLFPYIDAGTSAWFDRFVVEAFKFDVGDKQPVTLHREQSRLLAALLGRKDVAVSAPTSFGKSFVIDAFIASAKPKSVIIVVPTIALADETRRRLERRFGKSYKIVTAANQQLSEPYVVVAPQERIQGYISQLSNIDMLVIDEFYKASKVFDKERAPSLVHVMQRLSAKARQRYYLAPNIDELVESPLTRGMEFIKLNFNTVFLDKQELFQSIGRDEEKKSDVLLEILSKHQGKTLIYAGSYPNVGKVATLLVDACTSVKSPLLDQFGAWLRRHYGPNWVLPKLVVKGVGIHTGQLHRSISQIQVRLFEELEGLRRIISTSSIIEGVNTSAENVVLWSNKSGQARINDFTYRNIIGRGGRMFRHFVGKVFILEQPPQSAETQLELGFPDELLGVLGGSRNDRDYTPEQVARIREYEDEMGSLVGEVNLRALQDGALLQMNDSDVALRIARAVKKDEGKWASLRNLNSDDPRHWQNSLYSLVRLAPAGWDAPWRQFVEFVKVVAGNWEKSIPELLDELDESNAGVSDFFKLERTMTHRLAALLSDVNAIYNCAFPGSPMDLSKAIGRISHAFLPTAVFQLEEYGLPRMLSRKIQDSGVMDFEAEGLNLDSAVEKLRAMGLHGLVARVRTFEGFDGYLLGHFYEGLGVDDGTLRGGAS